jgi:hypothetical protein
VLHNFLGTFVSRNSDFSGYWIFGMIIGDLGHRRMDLLGPGPDGSDALAAAGRLARQQFHEQLHKSGLALSCIREATLELERTDRSRPVNVNGLMATGHELALTARVVTDLGKTYERKQSIYVAPHDPTVESRSLRADR